MQSLSSDAPSPSEDAESSGVYDVASQKIVGAGVTVGEGVHPQDLACCGVGDDLHGPSGVAVDQGARDL